MGVWWALGARHSEINRHGFVPNVLTHSFSITPGRQQGDEWVIFLKKCTQETSDSMKGKDKKKEDSNLARWRTLHEWQANFV